MSRQTFPVFVDQPGCVIRNFRITGANVTTTDSTAGLDGRGQFLCTISKDNATGAVYTINWDVTFGDIPYVFVQPSDGQLNTNAQITTLTNSQLVITSVLADDHSTAVAAPNLDIVVFGYNTTSYVS